MMNISTIFFNPSHLEMPASAKLLNHIDEFAKELNCTLW